MPEYAVSIAQLGIHAKVLESGVVDTVVFHTDDVRFLEIISDGAADIYYTDDGSTPTVAGQNCRRIPSGVDVMSVNTALVTIKLISSGAPEYSIQQAA